MKLEVGTTYRTRCGEEVTIVSYDPVETGDEVLCYLGSNEYWYSATGYMYDDEDPTDEDLILPTDIEGRLALLEEQVAKLIHTNKELKNAFI